MEVDRAYELIERAVKAGRAANAYLLVGGVRGMAGELAERVLHLLFGPGDLRVHPDIHRLMPEKKTRIISVEAMRERMIEPMEKTTFMGGWKAGVVLGADRLRTESANAFLKTLEEPPPHTLFLLLSERPEQLLPTIISRCQRIDLPDARAQQLEECAVVERPHGRDGARGGGGEARGRARGVEKPGGGPRAGGS